MTGAEESSVLPETGYGETVALIKKSKSKFYKILAVPVCFVGSALGLTGCAAPRPSVTGWASANSFSSDNSQVLADIQGVKNGIRLKELQQLHTVCEALDADAATVYQTLPTPVPALTQAFSKAYNALAQAGRTCYYAPSLSSPQMAKFKKEFSAATADLSYAMTLFNSFT